MAFRLFAVGALQMAVYGVGAQKRWRPMGATERRHIVGFLGFRTCNELQVVLSQLCKRRGSATEAAFETVFSQGGEGEVILFA